MAGRLDGKVALVTGGSSGIGQATALAFAREGATVIIADVVVDGGQATVSQIEIAGGEAIFVKTDVTKAAEVEALINKAAATFGRLDCAFNNAGVASPVKARTADYTEDDWDRVIDINLKGVFLCLKYELPQLVKQGGGAVVNAASAYGLVGGGSRKQGGSAYIASKHGVVGLTRAAALEYAHDNIRVNAVCPGFIDTPMMAGGLSNPEVQQQIVAMEPIGRVGQPDEVAEAVVWLCSEAASFVTGHAMAVDGGFVAQ